MIVPNKYEDLKTAIMRMTIRNPSFDDPLCLNGVSQYLALPDKFW